MAKLLTDEKSLDAANQQTGLSFQYLIEMLKIMQVRYAQHGEENKALHFESAADRIMKIFKKEFPTIYAG